MILSTSALFEKNNKMSVIKKRKLHYKALACRIGENTKYQGMSIAYSIPEQVSSDIGKIEASALSEDEKRRRIDLKLLDETNCHGYFFDQVPTMNFRHLYLESCNSTLDTYILKQPKTTGFQWWTLQEMCYQLVDSVAWLHQSNFYYDGQLHPRNIFVKTSSTQWKVKLKLSEKPNPFHSLDAEYVNSWSGIKQSDLIKSAKEKAIQKDLVSIAIIMYFIQSTGSHPFQIPSRGERMNYQAIQNQIKQGIFGELKALDKKCFCNDGNENCEETQCKYRSWINMLAKDHIHTGLYKLFNETKSYTNESAGKLMQHPFFWKTSDVLGFLEKSSNYLNEAGNEEKKNLFRVPARQSNTNTQTRRPISSAGAIQRSQRCQSGQLDLSLLNKVEESHKNIFDYLHEIPVWPEQHGQIPENRSFTLSSIKNFYMLLKQIRNKSSHWNETTACGDEAKKDLKNISFIPYNEMDGRVKFCLFWNIHIPSLILHTWKNLKDKFPLILFNPEHLLFLDSKDIHILRERMNYQAIQDQIKQGIFGRLKALDKKCFCNEENENCEETQCKYRSWINMLAEDRIRTGLYELFNETKSYTNESAGKLMQHPFFWKTSDVLTFVEKSSNYLNEAGNQNKKNLFCVSAQGQSNMNRRTQRSNSSAAAIQRSQPCRPGQLDRSLLSKLEKSHKNIYDYLHEKPSWPEQHGKIPENRSFTIPPIKNFYGLLKQIRNKSTHWNESSVRGDKAKIDLENISFVTNCEMDGQAKFCLFWNIHVPSLILYTWENLKDVITLQ